MAISIVKLQRLIDKGSRPDCIELLIMNNADEKMHHDFRKNFENIESLLWKEDAEWFIKLCKLITIAYDIVLVPFVNIQVQIQYHCQKSTKPLMLYENYIFTIGKLNGYLSMGGKFRVKIFYDPKGSTHR
ncbi:hypothetical protein APICC_01965 [Apis cerana cerana]|uniref:Uncharacterized protein n=1 Tax=Apis cerana cerana TaxID=94128 RepID=A0A2A3E072_APICC|nr:hypothetical protein APICC_01965 [Apis cerana cerana]